MSTLSNPIDPARFALALEDLSLSSLHAKAAELRNSIYHLRHSNAQLQSFADSGDQDCAEAISENEVVMDRFRERIDLLKAEVEKRGMPWVRWDEEGNVAEGDRRHDIVNGDGQSDGDARTMNGEDRADAPAMNGEQAAQNGVTNRQSGTLSDEELRRRMTEQLEEEEEGGLHL